MKPTCKSCANFVEETDNIGEYSHEEAVHKGHGFCLIKDLFTQADASDEACKEYQKEGRK